MNIFEGETAEEASKKGFLLTGEVLGLGEEEEGDLLGTGLRMENTQKKASLTKKSAKRTKDQKNRKAPGGPKVT